MNFAKYQPFFSSIYASFIANRPIDTSFISHVATKISSFSNLLVSFSDWRIQQNAHTNLSISREKRDQPVEAAETVFFSF